MNQKHIILRLVPLFSAIFVLLGMSSCSTERIIARQFLKHAEPEAILVLAPEFVYKKSYKLPDSVDFYNLSSEQYDSALLANTTIIKNVNDSIYLSAFVFGFNQELIQLGYSVYRPEETDEFLAKGVKSLIVNLAQSELEEYYDSIGEKVQFGDEDIYSYEFFVTSINMNYWFEINGVNHYDSIMPVLFNQQILSDRVEGGFRYFPFSGDVKYIYTVDSVELRDLYNASYKAGVLNATYLHDYLLNRYISKKMPDGRLPEKEFTYNRFSGSLKKLRVRGLTEL